MMREICLISTNINYWVAGMITELHQETITKIRQIGLKYTNK